MVNTYGLRGGWRAGALLVAVVVGAPLLSVTPAVAVHGAVPGDFNGDGYRDAVLPAPGANVAGKQGAGAVVVLYGSKSGLSTSRRATITQNTAGVPGAAEPDDGFGAATATADLNRDGYADLVVSAPYEDTARGEDAGTVTILWGSENGLTSGTDLPETTTDAYCGLDVAAVSMGPGAKTEVLVAGYEGTMRFTGPFSRRGTFGEARQNQETPSVGSVALGDFAKTGSPDDVSLTVRLSGLSGGEVYIDPVIGGAQQMGNGMIAATGDVNGDGYADLVVGDPDEPDHAGADGASGGRVLLRYGSAPVPVGAGAYVGGRRAPCPRPCGWPYRRDGALAFGRAREGAGSGMNRRSVPGSGVVLGAAMAVRPAPAWAAEGPVAAVSDADLAAARASWPLPNASTGTTTGGSTER